MLDGGPYFLARRLGHANLWVGDLARSEHFYNQVCGLAVEFTEPGIVASFLGTGHTPHDLGMIEVTGGKARYGRGGLLQIPAGVGTAVGLGHLAWEMGTEAQLVAAYKRAKASSLPITRTVDHQVAHSVYTADPDGNSVEFYCDTYKDWRATLHGEMDLITSAWDPEAQPPETDPRYDETPRLSFVPDALLHPQQMTHVVLTTRDVPALAAFYRGVGGLDTVWEARDGSAACLKASHPGYHFHLAICTGETPSYHHIAFRMADDRAVAEAEAQLKARGILPEASIDTPAKRSVFLRDPDDFRIEFYARRNDDFAALSKADPDMIPFLV